MKSNEGMMTNQLSFNPKIPFMTFKKVERNQDQLE